MRTLAAADPQRFLKTAIAHPGLSPHVMLVPGPYLKTEALVPSWLLVSIAVFRLGSVDGLIRRSQLEGQPVMANSEFVTVLQDSPRQRSGADQDLLAISDLVEHEAPRAIPDPGVQWGHVIPVRLQDHVAPWIRPKSNGLIGQCDRRARVRPVAEDETSESGSWLLAML